MNLRTITTVLATMLCAATVADCKCGKESCACKEKCSCTDTSCACTGCGAEAPSNWSYEPGAGISFNETPIVTAEFGVAFDSRYMTYGVIDGKATSVFWAA